MPVDELASVGVSRFGEVDVDVDARRGAASGRAVYAM